MSKAKKKSVEKTAPAFVQIAVCSTEHGDSVYGLDNAGRVWEWSLEHEIEGVGGWDLLPNNVFRHSRRR